MSDIQASELGHPLATWVPGALIPIGLLTAIFGAQMSRALEILGLSIMPHMIGGLMCVGGVLAVRGLRRGHRGVETAGLSVAACGCAVYGLGVLLGLGLGGTIAGGMYLALAGAFVSRTVRILKAARDL